MFVTSYNIHQHVTSCDMSKEAFLLKHFSCVISLEMKILACCKNCMMHFSSVYVELVETNLFTISLMSKLLNCDKFFIEIRT